MRLVARARSWYITGSSTSVSAQADSVPKTITTASGRWVSRPDAAAERRRHQPERGQRRGHQHRPQPLATAARGWPRRSRSPRWRRSAIAEITSTPFSDAWPISAMKPTAAATDSGMPREPAGRSRRP